MLTSAFNNSHTPKPILKHPPGWFLQPTDHLTDNYSSPSLSPLSAPMTCWICARDCSGVVGYVSDQTGEMRRDLPHDPDLLVQY